METAIKRSHFADGDLTPCLTKGVARPLWKPHLIVPASRSGVNIEIDSRIVAKEGVVRYLNMRPNGGRKILQIGD